ncbi:response regulator [Flavobacterium sp. FlaQc-51]|uniref:response regulator n=1 Tax=Flavobacterium sp. FlaQc-51 TaxID=3374184 RepID=UPI0037582DFF
MLYKNILLIDDDIDDAELFLEVINSLKKEISFSYATDPLKALAELKISEKLSDLMFLDINMPCLNGLDLLNELQNDTKLRYIEVIVISSAPEDIIRKNLSTKKYEIGRYMRKLNNYNDFVDQMRTLL